MPTIKEIAKACGVSIATVSNVLNNKCGVGEETKLRIQQVIEEMNYTPNYVARNLKMKRTRSIGVIAEDMTVFVMPGIIDGITDYFEKEDYQILLINLRLYNRYGEAYYHNDTYKSIVHREIHRLKSKQVDGIIYVAAHERKINVLPKGLGVPLVVAYSFADGPQSPSVVVGDRKGSEEIVSYLIQNGHTKIGVVAGKKYSLHTQARLEGYQNALYKENILYNPELIVYGDWERKSGYECTRALLEKGVTAFFCMNDFMAGGIYDCLDELGYKVGEDIAVTGFDNREMASYEKPPLTTVGLPLYDIGYCASDVLKKQLNEETPVAGSEIYYADCKLLIRNSVNKLEGQVE